jgi:hypothetical protein
MSRKNYVLQGINRHLIVILIVQRISHKLPTDELNLAERPLVGSSRQEVVAIPKTLTSQHPLYNDIVEYKPIVNPSFQEAVATTTSVLEPIALEVEATGNLASVSSDSNRQTARIVASGDFIHIVAAGQRVTLSASFSTRPRRFVLNGGIIFSEPSVSN